MEDGIRDFVYFLTGSTGIVPAGEELLVRHEAKKAKREQEKTKEDTKAKEHAYKMAARIAQNPSFSLPPADSGEVVKVRTTGDCSQIAAALYDIIVMPPKQQLRTTCYDDNGSKTSVMHLYVTKQQ